MAEDVGVCPRCRQPQRLLAGRVLPHLVATGWRACDGADQPAALGDAELSAETILVGEFTDATLADVLSCTIVEREWVIQGPDDTPVSPISAAATLVQAMLSTIAARTERGDSTDDA